MAQHQLAAKIRETKGKEAAKKLRRENKIPAVFYGADSEPIMLFVEESELKKLLKSTASDNIIMGLKIETENGIEDKMVILKELQSDPLKDLYLHADFHEIKMDQELTMNIPVILVNTPAGVIEGGILQAVRRELEVSCLPDKVIETIEVDVSNLEIGDSIHIEDITLPEGITSTQEGHLTVAVVNAPIVEEEPEEEEEELEEGEGEETEEGEGETPEETEAE